MKLVDKYRWGANSNVPISNINPGDFVYKASNISGQITNIIAVGTINQAVTSSTTSSISIVGGFVNTPNPGDYIFINKKSSVESYGSRGRYLNLTLSLSAWEATGEIELFAVKTSVFKSFP